jgi:hypothetical protein
MSAETVYDEIRDLVKQHVSPEVDGSTLERLTLVVAGMIHADHAAPARIARAIEQLARAHLCWSQPQELLLIIDPTTQDDRVVMVSVAVWYRGRALPLAWAIWPGNKLLEGLRFWERIDALLELVASLLPDHVPVTWLADRAFGAALFIDLLTKRHWHYVLRVQDQTVSRDSQGREKPLRQLVRLPGQRRKLRGEVFKKRGWRPCHVVAYWGRRHKSPLCLISDLGAHWYLIRLYRRRYPIEATFRDYKSSGWQWEQGQVIHLDHLERLLVGMALATWIAIMTGTQVAAEYLAQPPTGRRRTMPPQGKHSLFQLGLSRLQKLLVGSQSEPLAWRLTDWDAPNWREQIHFHHAYAFIFAWR